jgi:hypothetical protein
VCRQPTPSHETAGIVLDAEGNAPNYILHQSLHTVTLGSLCIRCRMMDSFQISHTIMPYLSDMRVLWVCVAPPPSLYLSLSCSSSLSLFDLHYILRSRTQRRARQDHLSKTFAEGRGEWGPYALQRRHSRVCASRRSATYMAAGAIIATIDKQLIVVALSTILSK